MFDVVIANILIEKIERILSECGRVVLDLGAGHTHYEDPILFDRVYRAIALCPNVVLLLPSADLDRSVRLLRERCLLDRLESFVSIEQLRSSITNPAIDLDRDLGLWEDAQGKLIGFGELSVADLSIATPILPMSSI